MGETIKQQQQQQQQIEKIRKKETEEAETQEATVESRKRDRDGECIQLSNNDGWNGGRGQQWSGGQQWNGATEVEDSNGITDIDRGGKYCISFN